MLAAMSGYQRLVAVAMLIASGCGTGSDETVEGARAQCAYGGELLDCAPADRTSEGACWRLVDCGAIPVSGEEEFDFDWGRCVDGIDSLTAERQRLVISCIAHSICDELRVSGSPDDPNEDAIPCFHVGAR